MMLAEETWHIFGYDNLPDERIFEIISLINTFLVYDEVWKEINIRL